MSDIIKLLPDSVANQIAAGEVIQRPASVIKELVENAVDAGATHIQVFVKDGGRTLIQVVDNGKGMSRMDARMAFERHATSKIKSADDLSSLRTMGFRGEALPSICAISQLEIRTRTEDDAMGTRLLINGSKVDLQESCVCERGTSIWVRNIFFNIPARRKFMKSDNVELSNIMREFERLALVNNTVRMSIDTGTRQIDLRPGTFHQRIEELWKNNLKMQLLPVNVDTELVKISGFIGRPEFARRRNALQFMIANGRNMRHPSFHKAIVQCYEGLIANDTQPNYFLKFDLDPATIDVNIHPTKNEIKFEYESEIRPILMAAVRGSLGKNAMVPTIDFEHDALPVKPLGIGELPERPQVDMPEGYNPFASPSRSHGAYRPSGTADWETLYGDFMKGGADAPGMDEALRRDEEAPAAVIPGMEEIAQEGTINPMCLQFGLKYIVSTAAGGVMLIDQHRAHLKVLYERYLQNARHEETVSQKVMFPHTLTVEPMLQPVLEETMEELKHVGFELEYADGNEWEITGTPPNMQNADPADIILRVLESISEEAQNYGRDNTAVERTLLERVALVVARSNAIRRGVRLTEQEMESLVAELFTLPDPTYIPTGRKIYTILDETTIASLLP